ncbi:MAG: cobalamin-dependent protein [Desulfobacterales bacterium]|nr:cobalamin-dependent protein [Desulfobacterales bacterium]MDP6806597.1 cobalamin-dependent protein [Desulfobacterales bacterium]
MRGPAIDERYFDKLAQTVIDGQEEECLRVIHEGLNNGMDPLEAVEKGLAKGINKVGNDFAEEIVFLPELVMAADVMKAGMKILDEKIKAEGKERKSLGKIVIGTVKGDIHDIGKSVVAAVLQANGFDVIDLGMDVEPDAFIQTVVDNDADCLGMSTLLTLTLSVMGETIKKMEEKGLREKVKVIVGGCPVTQEFGDEVGADAVGFDSKDGLTKVSELLSV